VVGHGVEAGFHGGVEFVEGGFAHRGRVRPRQAAADFSPDFGRGIASRSARRG
jgi:hypothetical protein